MVIAADARGDRFIRLTFNAKEEKRSRYGDQREIEIAHLVDVESERGALLKRKL